MPNVTANDFFRIHLFRAEAVYLELARRLTLVCTDKTAKVTTTAFSINQWIAYQNTLLQAASGRRSLKAEAPEEAPGLHERALKIIEVTKLHGDEMSRPNGGTTKLSIGPFDLVSISSRPRARFQRSQSPYSRGRP